MAKKNDLDTALNTPAKITLSTGAEVEFYPFRLRELTQAGEVLAKLANCFNLSALSKGGEGLEINAPMLIYVVFENDLNLILTLLSLSTRQPAENFLDLELDDFYTLLGEAWEHTLKPAFEEAGKSLKKKAPTLLEAGLTQSSDSPVQGSP